MKGFKKLMRKSTFVNNPNKKTSLPGMINISFLFHDFYKKNIVRDFSSCKLFKLYIDGSKNKRMYSKVKVEIEQMWHTLGC